MKYSEQAMKESFYTSNISPQRPGLNRGIWKQLEEKIRDWAPVNRPLFIATGPVLNEPLEQFIGYYNRITVPKRFFKVILDTAQPARAIGFIFQNASTTLPLTSFAMSVDAVEKVTGYDFFPNLADVNEIALEKSVNVSRWDFN
jgi:endonuclease G